MRFLLRRILSTALQLLLLSVAIHALFRLAPGDYFSSEALDPQRSEQSLEAAREARGLRQSWVRQYLDWARSSLRGDFGTSLAYGLPVSQLLAPRIPKTLEIAVAAMGMAWLLGAGGAVLGLRLRLTGSLDPGAAAATMLPDVVTISLLLWIAVWAGISITGPWLPILGMVIGMAPMVFIHASGALRTAREQEFVRLAESRGITGTRLWLDYILRAAANPLVTLAGLSVAAAIGSSFVAEVLTGWPGVGPLVLEAVRARDYPVVQTVLMLLAGTLSVSNLVSDLVLYRLDPRIRSGA